MSTKPIREALERIQCTCRDHSCVGCKAEAAVSAIEFAARSLDAGANGPGWESPNVHEAFALMASIAKDEP